MENYFEIILEDKIYAQRTPNSKFIEFDLNNIKQKSYDELPCDIKKIINEAKDMEENPKKYFDYITRDNVVIIIEIAPTKSQYIKIPEKIDGLPVAVLGPELCRNIKETVTQIQLPETITNFSDSTFSNCENLRYVNIPKNLIHIPNNCFANCTRLRKINLENIEEIGEQAFKCCNSLKDITLNKIKVFGAAAFYFCANLYSVQINSDEIREIANRSFMRCVTLTHLKLPDNIEIIGRSAFRGCVELPFFVSPKNLKQVKDMAFSGNRFKSIILYDKLEEVGKLSFYTKQNIPTKVTMTDETVYYTDSFSEYSKIKIIDDKNTEEREVEK